MENNEKLPPLLDCQKEQYDVLMKGNNCYLFGEAGTGKSVLLKHFIQDSRKLGKKVVVCAPTGMAADHIDGTTVHRAFGYPIGVVNASGEKKVIKISIGRKPNIENILVVKEPIRFAVNEVLREADIIIIDEISSLRMDLFELLTNQIMDTNRKRNIDNCINGEGLIQLVVAGDFFQTGPVSVKKDSQKKDEPQLLKKMYKTYNSGYAFESENWDKMQFEYVKLSQVIRQEDKLFSEALSYIRTCTGTENIGKILSWFNSKINKTWDGETMVICGTNEEAKTINDSCLAKLDGREYTFEDSMESLGWNELTDEDRRAEAKITLKVGARVQLLVNDKYERYSNGSTGTVTKIFKDYCVVKFDKYPQEVEVGRYTWNIKNGKDEVIGRITQLPVRLGYASTVHKIQGQTLDKICIKPDIFFDVAMHYVALGRCKDLNEIQFYNDSKFKMNCTFKSGYSKPVQLVSYEVLEFARKHNLL